MTLTELTAYVRLQLNELSEAHWDDDDIKSYIANGMNEFIRKTHCAVQTDTITLDGTGVYDLTQLVLKDRGSIYINGDGEKFQAVRIAEEDWLRFTDDEKRDGYYYYIDRANNQLNISAEYTSGTFSFIYYYKGSLGALDVLWALPIIPEEYHEHIGEYCLAKGLERDRLFSDARYYRSNYKKSFEEAKEAIAEEMPSSTADDWTTQIINVHRDEGELMQGSIQL